MKSIFTISTLLAASALGLATPRSPAVEGYSLNLTLVDSPEGQYWLLTDENLPAATPSSAAIATSAKLAGRQAPTPQCYPSNLANRWHCSDLLGFLQYDGTSLPGSPRDIRYETCYVSWSKAVSGARRYHLFAAGYETLGWCQGDRISGLRRQVTLGSTTGVTQCLSNRPNGCS